MTTSTRKLFTALAALALVVGLAACGDDDDKSSSATTDASSSSGSGGAITVGAKLDPEAQLLGNLMAQTLEAKGYDVTTKIPTGNTDVTRQALTSDSIDIYWEFTSSGLTLLKQDPIGDPQEAYDKAKELDAKNGITWLPSADMNDTYALAVAEDGDVKATTMSELKDEVDGLKLCVDPEGGFRKDVLPLVKTSYDIEFTDTTQVGADLIPQAVKRWQVRCRHRVLDVVPHPEEQPAHPGRRQVGVRRLHPGAHHQDGQVEGLPQPGEGPLSPHRSARHPDHHRPQRQGRWRREEDQAGRRELPEGEGHRHVLTPRPGAPDQEPVRRTAGPSGIANMCSIAWVAWDRIARPSRGLRSCGGTWPTARRRRASCSSRCVARSVAGEFRGMEFLHVQARRIINEVKGADASPLPFRFTINPYRGCSHACTYCFARPTHEYLGLGIGADFDQRIVVKVNAVERLRAELAPARWAGDLIAMGTNTDPYQRCEGKYRLTRGIIRTLTEAGNPFSILTKSTLVLRDLELLAEAARSNRGPREPFGRHAGRGRVAVDRARHAPPTPAAAGGRAAQRSRGALRCAGGAGPARPVGFAGAARRGGAGLRRGRSGVGVDDAAAPAPRREGAFPGRAPSDPPAAAGPIFDDVPRRICPSGREPQGVCSPTCRGTSARAHRRRRRRRRQPPQRRTAARLRLQCGLGMSHGSWTSGSDVCVGQPRLATNV